MAVAAVGVGRSCSRDNVGGDRGQHFSESDVDDDLTREPDDDLGDGNGSGLHPAAAEDEDLNESQRNAVFAEIGAVRVVAGPGSGKTRVLTRRIAHLVRDVGAPAWSILAVTFTKKASEEMRIRVRNALGEDISGQVALGTFHSVCARLLRRHGDALPAVVPGLDGRFSIFDTEDSRKMLADIIKENGLDVKEVKPAVIRSSISKLKSQGLGPEDIREQCKDLVGNAKKRAQTMAQIYHTYQTRLVASNAVDFDDIILVALRLLRQDKEVFRAVGRQYRHILVDEWQDTNGPQYDLVLEIVRAGREAQLAREEARRAAREAREGAGLPAPEAAAATTAAGPLGIQAPPQPPSPPPSIFVVGDTDQCIYKFRGADYTNVARFVEDFEGCRTVLLRENYRSTANIATAATAVIGQVSGRAEQATVATTAVQGDGLPIGVMVCSDAAGEAEAVTHQLELYWTSGRVPPSEMAVMYRTNAQSRSFEEACLRKALPFVVVGAQRFYERREVKDCVVYLRLAANPRDTVAMRRAINTPTRGIGPKTEEALETLAISARRNIQGLEGITVPECLMSLLDPKDLDELESVLGGAAAAVCSAGELPSISSSAPLSEEGTLGGGFGVWPGEDQGVYAAAMAAAGVANDDGWAGFSVPRVRLLRSAMSSSPPPKKKKKTEDEDEGEERAPVDAMLEGPTKAQTNKLKVFAQVLCRLRVASATQSVPELLNVVLEETDMHKHVTETLATTGPAEGEDRWQNVVELERAASNPKFSGVAGNGALVLFLNEVALVGGDDPKQERKQREEAEAGGAGVETGQPAKPSMIQLMTVHASKGLEFDTVFVTGCEEGTFPMKNTTDDLMDEERRLMYVGMTRAKARLFLSWRKRRMVFGQSLGKDKRGAQTVDSERSRFLDDIPANIVSIIDKTALGNGSGVEGARNRVYVGKDGRSESVQRRVAYGGGGGSASPSGGGGYGIEREVSTRGGSGAAAEEPERDPTMDFLTELSNSVSREAQAQRSRAGGVARGGGYSSGYPSTNGGNRYGEGGGGGGVRRAEYGVGGGGGGGRSYETKSSRTARIFKEKRDKAVKARYPVPDLRDGGKRLARDSGEEVDISWAAKMVSAAPEAPELPPGVVVGAQVSHPIHGPGQVVALVEGSEAVNVRFVSKGEPFANVIHRKLVREPDSVPQAGDGVGRPLFLRKVTEEALRVTREEFPAFRKALEREGWDLSRVTLGCGPWLLHLSECSTEPCNICHPVKKFIEDARMSCINQRREQDKSEEASEASIASLTKRFADTVVAARQLDCVSKLMVGSDQPGEASKIVKAISSLSAGPHQPVGANQRPPAETGRARTRPTREEIEARSSKRVRVDPSCWDDSKSNTSTEHAPASAFRHRTSTVAGKNQCEGCGGSGQERREPPKQDLGVWMGIGVDKGDHASQPKTSPVNDVVGVGVTDEAASCSPGDDGEIESVSSAEDDTSECSFGESLNKKGDDIIDEQRSLLIVLHHIYTCRKEEGECRVTDCAGMKRIWGHARACDRHKAATRL
eukprot:g13298.t1